MEGLVNDPLACERSITVQQNGHYLRNHSASLQTSSKDEGVMFTPAPGSAYPLALSVSAVELLRFSLALHHRIHRLQVGGVRHEGHCDVLVADSVQPPVIHPQVIFHIARALTTNEIGF